MLRKIMIAAVAAVVALSFTACSSLQVATTLNNEKITTAENATSLAHINGEIWGTTCSAFRCSPEAAHSREDAQSLPIRFRSTTPSPW